MELGMIFICFLGDMTSSVVKFRSTLALLKIICLLHKSQSNNEVLQD
jgi:hypothetical protein